MPSPDRHHFMPKDEPEVRGPVGGGGGGPLVAGVFVVKVTYESGDSPDFLYTVEDLEGNVLGVGVPSEEAHHLAWEGQYEPAAKGSYGLAFYDGLTLKLLTALGEYIT
jgi:hypothetical protein